MAQEEKIAIARILYMARKVLAYHWLDEDPPLIGELVSKVNWLLSLERGVYIKRGVPLKFEKLWGRWLDVPGLAPLKLTASRPDMAVTLNR